jgi:hypothetical protein
MSSSSGYVDVPRCSVIFDETNYTEFVAFMRIHMWRVEVSNFSCGSYPADAIGSY